MTSLPTSGPDTSPLAPLVTRTVAAVPRGRHRPAVAPAGGGRARHHVVGAPRRRARGLGPRRVGDGSRGVALRGARVVVAVRVRVRRGPRRGRPARHRTGRLRRRLVCRRLAFRRHARRAVGRRRPTRRPLVGDDDHDRRTRLRRASDAGRSRRRRGARRGRLRRRLAVTDRVGAVPSPRQSPRIQAATSTRSSSPATSTSARLRRSTCGGCCAGWPRATSRRWVFARRRAGRRDARAARPPREGPGHLARARRDDPPHRRRRARPRARRVAGALVEGPRGARVRRALGRRCPRAALLVDERARGAVRAAPAQRHAPRDRRGRACSPTTRRRSRWPPRSTRAPPSAAPRPRWPTRSSRELEHMDRGRYAGPVGWMDASGDGEWGIALRSARDPPGRPAADARCIAGCGIVAGSIRRPRWPSPTPSSIPMRDALTAPRP